MSFILPVLDSFKDRIFEYFLKRYLGDFLLEGCSLKNSKLNFADGRACGSVSNIQLDADALNDKFDWLPLKFTDNAVVNEIEAFIPWSKLLTDSSTVRIDGIKLYCEMDPKDDDLKSNDGNYLTNSLMTSSMQIAEEIAKDTNPNRLEGLEALANVIESVLSRVELVFTNTIIVLHDSGTADNPNRVEIRIRRAEWNKEEQLSEEMEKLAMNSQEDADDDTDDNGDSGSENGGKKKKREKNEKKKKLQQFKIIMIDGIEIFVNDNCVCRLGNKHMIKLNKDANSIQVFIGSILYTVLTPDQLSVICNVFCKSKSPKTPVNEDQFVDRPISDEDYMRIEEQLKRDFASRNKPSTSSISAGQHSFWAYGVGSGAMADAEEKKFLPFVEDTQSNASDHDGGHPYTFNLKIPGVVICLTDKETEKTDAEVPMVECTFEAINRFLDKKDQALGDHHLRSIFLNLELHLINTQVSLELSDILLTENCGQNKQILLISERADKLSNTTNYKVVVNGDDVHVTSKSNTSVRLDPTFIERVDKFIQLNLNGMSAYTASASSSYSDASSTSITVDFAKIDGIIHFPVPDHRPEAKNKHSELRNELIHFVSRKMQLVISQKSFAITAETMDLRLIDRSKSLKSNIINLQSVKQKPIEFKLTKGARMDEPKQIEFLKPTALFTEGMEDSIYIRSQLDMSKLNPFQVKRRIVKENISETEEIIAPSDRISTLHYLETALTSTEYQIEVSIPKMFATIESKQVMNIIYNRLFNDAILWKPFNNYDEGDADDKVKRKISNKEKTSYYPCKSGMEESTDSEDLFHSFVGSTNSLSNLATLVFNVDEASVTIGAGSEKQLIGSKDLLVGVVLSLYEQSKNIIFVNGDYVSYKDTSEVLIGCNKFTNSSCKVNLVLEIYVESPELKKIKVAVQVCDGMLYKLNLNRFISLWEMVNVTNEEITGYLPPNVLTEFYLNLVNSAIVTEHPECRPALLTCDDANITCMIIEGTTDTLLRFIFEETSVFFKKDLAQAAILSNYVCILNCGLVELNLRMSDEKVKEMKVSNNIINIRACSDSLAALGTLFHCLNEVSGSDDAPPPYTEMEQQAPNVPKVDKVLMEDAMQDETYEPSNLLREEKSCNCEENYLDESVFWVLGDDDIGAGIKGSTEPQLRMIGDQDEPVHINVNYHEPPKQKSLPELFPNILTRLMLEEMSIVFHLFAGRDFEEPMVDVTKCDAASDSDELKFDNDFFTNDDHKVRFADNNVLWEDLDLVSENSSTADFETQFSSSFKTTGGKLRQNDVCVKIYFLKVKTLFDRFVEDNAMSWRFLFMVNEIEIKDCVKSSMINKMLYEYCSESMPRRNSGMLSVSATTYRKDGNEECDLNISLKPLRLNIDQDTIMFLVEFFNQFSLYLDMSAGGPTSGKMDQQCQNTEYVPECRFEDPDLASLNQYSNSNAPLFIRSFQFSPDVPIKLDYHGKRVDFEQGAIAGLLMGLAQLNQSELKLKKLQYKYGILGFEKLFLFVITGWIQDIKRHQLPSILGGVGPVHSFVQLFQGIKDLIWMPIDQYRKDRRLVRGIQRGVFSFSSSTTIAVLDLATRALNIIECTAQFAHDCMSTRMIRRRQLHLRSHNPRQQPRDVREGALTAYNVFTEGFHQAARNVTSAGTSEPGSLIPNLIREIPANVLLPIIHSSQATSNMLLGVRNQMTPEARKDDQDKWKNV